MNSSEFRFDRWLNEIRFYPGRIAAIVLSLTVITLPTLSAATFTVSSTADSGPGSLRAAVAAAQTSSGPNLIQFAHGVRGSIVLTSGAIAISQSLTIAGPGAHRLSISGNDADRVFDIEGGSATTVSISGVKIKHGVAGSSSLHGSVGGAIYISGATLTLAGVVLSRNRAIDSVGSTAEGGAIAIVGNGTVNASDITVQRNRALSSSGGAGLGGGVFVDAGSTLSLSDSLVTLNDALGNPGIGGGVYSLGISSFDALTSITGNTASTSGNDVGP
jgi:hypothetical protein